MDIRNKRPVAYLLSILLIVGSVPNTPFPGMFFGEVAYGFYSGGAGSGTENIDSDSDGTPDTDDPCPNDATDTCPAARTFWDWFGNILGYFWTSVYTIFGLIVGATGTIVGIIVGSDPSIVAQNNAIWFVNNPLVAPGFGATTYGNTVISNPSIDYSHCYIGEHEEEHTRQYQWWGPLFHLAYVLDVLLNGGYSGSEFEKKANDHAKNAC